LTVTGPEKTRLLAALPSVDEVLKSPAGTAWLAVYRRPIVLQAVREVIAEKRDLIIGGRTPDLASDTIAGEFLAKIRKLSAFSLVPVINATGIVIHTNLGRAPLSEEIIRHVVEVAGHYSTLEYDLQAGRRGKRHTHTARLLKEVTGAEDAFVVNNNAAAVFLSLNSLAQGREVIVSRGELVEIGGSFRVPDVMAASGAVLREVGTTNKTHLRDYAQAVNEDTALILKVHQSNYRITGFAQDVSIADLVSLGRERQLPVMFDLGSGSLLDLRQYGIPDEPSVQAVVKEGVDIVTFSGDKLLGGPQGGIIAGKRRLVERLQKNPLARALRVDKMTIAAFEATLQEYLDPEAAVRRVPVLNLLFQPRDEIRARAKRMAAALRRRITNAKIAVEEGVSKAGGGALPEIEFPTSLVTIRPESLSVNDLDSRLRSGRPPVIARIKDNALVLDARSVLDAEVAPAVQAVTTLFTEE
jgi:L-seryl-tRNA(Ser) seleniumtransferase